MLPFFLVQTKIKTACACNPLPSPTSHVIRPLLSQSAVFPRGGARCYCCYGNRWLCQFHKNKLFMLRKKEPVTHQQQSIDRKQLKTSGRIHLGIQSLSALNNKTTCILALLSHSCVYMSTNICEKQRFLMVGITERRGIT